LEEFKIRDKSPWNKKLSETKFKKSKWKLNPQQLYFYNEIHLGADNKQWIFTLNQQIQNIHKFIKFNDFQKKKNSLVYRFVIFVAE
jgi:hypothetical protein